VGRGVTSGPCRSTSPTNPSPTVPQLLFAIALFALVVAIVALAKGPTSHR
jgi:hypothetical protein